MNTDIRSELDRTGPSVDYLGEIFHGGDDTSRITSRQYALDRTYRPRGATMRIAMSTSCERLRWARINAGYKTAKAFARELGVGESTYNQWENGRTELDKPKALRIARFLKNDEVTAHWLLFGNNEHAPIQPTDETVKSARRQLAVSKDDWSRAYRDLVDRYHEAYHEEGIEAPAGDVALRALQDARDMFDAIERLSQIDGWIRKLYKDLRDELRERRRHTPQTEHGS